VQTILTVNSALEFLIQNAAAIAMVLAALTAILRTIWTAIKDEVKESHPVLHKTIEVVASISPDIIQFFRLVFEIIKLINNTIKQKK